MMQLVLVELESLGAQAFQGSCMMQSTTQLVSCAAGVAAWPLRRNQLFCLGLVSCSCCSSEEYSTSDASTVDMACM
jgi:hypothetical protein